MIGNSALADCAGRTLPPCEGAPQHLQSQLGAQQPAHSEGWPLPMLQWARWSALTALSLQGHKRDCLSPKLKPCTEPRQVIVTMAMLSTSAVALYKVNTCKIIQGRQVLWVQWWCLLTFWGGVGVGQERCSSKQNFLASFLGCTLLHQPLSKVSHVVGLKVRVPFLHSFDCLQKTRPAHLQVIISHTLGLSGLGAGSV